MFNWCSSIERGGGGVLAHLVRKTYHIYMQNYPNSACTKNTPDLHAELLQFCMCKKHFFVNAAILHVHIWRWGVLAHLVRKTYHIYMQNYPNSACTQNTFFAHALARQFCMFTKHIWRWRDYFTFIAISMCAMILAF